MIRIRDLAASTVETKYEGPFDPRWIVRFGDILIGMDGDFSIVRWRNIDALLNQRILKVDPKPGSRIAKDFFYYWSGPRLSRIHARTAATTVKHLSFRDLEAATDYFPQLEEQQRIAEILSTLDEAIEQTEALIAKTQAIKAGLMHDLFTRGVNANGELRPPRDEAPQLYKDSPLGWIPRDWCCRAVEELLAQTACPMRSGPFGSALLKDELVEDGVPLLGIDNVFRERFVASYSRNVTSHKFVELHRYAVFPGDVIITIMGTVGRCCIAPDDLGSALSSKHLWTMTFDQNSVIPELVCWQLNYANWVRAWIARHSQGAVMEAIQSSTLRSLMLPVPPMHEQKRMRDAYRACSLTVTMEEENRDKLLQYKHGLMHDLLTGRVPVPLPEPEALAADA